MTGGRARRIVALGGGHGLSASLSALRDVTEFLTAVVTVADDGGSSGRLRAAYDDLLPPGDLRMALTALAGRSPRAQLLRDTFQRRFGAGRDVSAGTELAGHPVGNLLLAGLMLETGDPVAALDAAGELLEVGPGVRVLPMAREPLDIAARVYGAAGDDDLITVRGQVEVATTSGRVVSVELVPPSPVACVEAVAAVEQADAIVLGPGSLFTSVLPHLLMPELRKAIAASSAMKVLILNLVAQPGETDGFSAESHLEVLGALIPELTFSWVIAHDGSTDDRAFPGAAQRFSDPDRSTDGAKRGLIGDLHTAAESLGARVHLAPVARADSPGVHDTAALTEALRFVLAHGQPDSGPNRVIAVADEGHGSSSDSSG